MTADLDDLRSAFAELTALHGWAPLQTRAACSSP